MSATRYVIAPSYLIEWFACGRDSNPKASAEVRRRCNQANAGGGRFFVPLPCLFELGDHIADVGHDAVRKKLVERLVSTVRSSLASCRPWTITPPAHPKLCCPNFWNGSRRWPASRNSPRDTKFVVFEAQVFPTGVVPFRGNLKKSETANPRRSAFRVRWPHAAPFSWRSGAPHVGGYGAGTAGFPPTLLAAQGTTCKPNGANREIPPICTCAKSR